MSSNGALSGDSDVAQTSPVPEKDRATFNVIAMDVKSQEIKDEERLSMGDEKEGEKTRQMSTAKAVLLAIPLVATIFVVAMDNYIVAPAMPTIAAELSANDASFAWIESAELLAWAVAVPIWGRSSDFLGRKPMILSALTVVFLGTAIGGFASSIAMLLAGRTVQGLGCGGLAVMANICVADLFSGRQRGVYYSALGTIIGVASAIGPCVGGALTSAASWRWCFWLNLPIVAVAFVCIIWYLDLPSPKGCLFDGLKAIDWPGTFLIVAATVLFLVGLQFGGIQFPWRSPAVICMIVIGALGFGAFIFVEGWLAPRPLIPLSIFKDRSRNMILLVMFGQSLLSVACKLFLPLYYQLSLGVSPLISTVYLLPFALVTAAIFPIIGWLVKKTGKYRSIMCFGAPFLVVGSGLMINSKSEVNWPLIIIPQVLLAIGHGCTYQSPLIAFQAQLKDLDIAAGQSSFNFLRTIAEMLSAVFGQIILQARITGQTSKLAQIGLSRDLVQQILTGQAIASKSSIQALTVTQRAAVAEITTSGFAAVWIFYTVVAGIMFLATFAVSDIEIEE